MRKKVLTYNTFHDLYALILFLNIFGLGAFGIYPATSSFLEKQNFLRELKSKNEELSSLLVKAQEATQIHEQLQGYLPALNALIPDSTHGDRVVTELLVLTAKEGYVLKDVSLSSVDENSSAISCSAEGPFEKLSGLLGALESTTLSIEVAEVRVSFSEQDAEHLSRISINLNVYSLGETIYEEE